MARRGGGGADLVRAYVKDRLIQRYHESNPQLPQGAPRPDVPFSFISPYIDPEYRETLENLLRDDAERLQDPNGCGAFGNIHALRIPDHPAAEDAFICSYVFGRYLLLSLHNLFGEAAFSSALQELHHLLPPGSLRPTEEEIYGVFLKHTPPGLEREFRALYKRVHGGPFLNADS